MSPPEPRTDRVAAHATSDRPATAASRFVPVDALRGLIMIVMALDHANAFIAHGKAEPEFWSGAFPHYDSALQFLTRFVTHLSAPGFFFLMGAGMAMFAASRRRLGWTEGAIARHYLGRGVFLIGLQLFVENRAWLIGQPTGNLFAPIYFGVLYGLGAAMLVGPVLLRLRSAALSGLSVAAILATEILLPEPSGALLPVAAWLRLLLIPGFSGNTLVFYPLIPWLGLVGFGIVFGRQLQQAPSRAYRGALVLGLAFVVLFLVVRVLGGFGNIRPPQGPGWIAFLNVVKYPPSLVFVLLTLGSDLLLLAFFARFRGATQHWLQPLVVFGQSPLFFYIAHLYLYGFMGLAFGPQGTTIPQMYPYWLLGLLLLYPLCWFYGNFKLQQAPGSLWRFG